MTNTTDAIRVLYVDDSADVSHITESLAGAADRITVQPASNVAEAQQRVDDGTIDCVVSEYDLPDGDGLELLETIRMQSSTLPFMMVTDAGSEAIASEAITAGVTDYLRKQHETDDYGLLATRIEEAIDAVQATERANRQQQINGMVRKINEALVHARTPAAIDSAVCRIVADADPYRFAWIGEHDVAERTVTPRASAGVDEAYLESIEITTDDQPTGLGPTGRAVRSHTLAVMQNIPDDPQFEPWREAALDRGYRSSAAVPLCFDDALYGVLNVYADRTNAFDEPERNLLADLGETIAHAHHRIELQHQYTDQYRRLFTDAPVMVAITRSEGGDPIIEDCNEAFADRLGYSMPALRETSLGEYYSDASHEKLLGENGYQRALDGEFVREQRTLLTHDGEEVLTVLRASPRRDRDGTVVGTHALFLDITNERQIRALEWTNELLSTLISALPEGILVEDTDREIVTVNQRLLDLLGQPRIPEGVIGGNGARFTSAIKNAFEESERFVTRTEVAIDARDPIDSEILDCADGRTLERSYRPIELPARDGCLWVYRDVTDRQERERELERRNERLDTFVSVLSHDLRNPLNVAQGRMELLKDTIDNEHLESIDRAHTRMESLIDGLLKLAREGSAVTDPEPVDLATVVPSCWQTVETGAATLSVDIERTVSGERSRLQQVFENLFRNAVEHGGSDVSVRVGELAAGSGFFVEDDGPGITAAARDTVFEVSYSTRTDGSGFGLSIVKRIVEAHGWSVHVTAGTDGGARFEFTGVEFLED